MKMVISTRVLRRPIRVSRTENGVENSMGTKVTIQEPRELPATSEN